VLSLLLYDFWAVYLEKSALLSALLPARRRIVRPSPSIITAVYDCAMISTTNRVPSHQRYACEGGVDYGTATRQAKKFLGFFRRDQQWITATRLIVRAAWRSWGRIHHTLHSVEASLRASTDEVIELGTKNPVGERSIGIRWWRAYSFSGHSFGTSTGQEGRRAWTTVMRNPSCLLPEAIVARILPIDPLPPELEPRRRLELSVAVVLASACD